MSADPSDIQSQLDALSRRRQLAEAMQQQYSQPQQQQVVGGRIMDQGAAPLMQGLASVVAGIRANKMGTQMQGLQKQQQDGARSALDEYQNAPPEQKQAALQKLQLASGSPMSLAQQVIARAMTPKNPIIMKKEEKAYDPITHQPIVGMEGPPAEPKPMQHTADDLIFDGKNYRDPDGNIFNSKQVQDWRTKMAGDRAKATTASKGSFGTKEGDLLAAFAEQGISLPAGLRSKEQQLATVQSLLSRHPDLSTDEIATKVKSGQIGFGAEKKETTTAAATAGRVGVAQNEIKEFTPLLIQASAAVPRGKFVPLNQLMQTADSSISDPALKNLKIKVNAMLNAYDMLAARGGTDKDKRQAAHKLLLAADSHNALVIGAKAFGEEADAAERAARKAELPFAERDKAAHPPEIQSLLDKYK